MHALIRSKYRLFALVSIVVMTQCCCLLLPLQIRIRQDQQRQIIQTLQTTYRANLHAARSFILFSK